MLQNWTSKAVAGRGWTRGKRRNPMEMGSKFYGVGLVLFVALCSLLLVGCVLTPLAPVEGTSGAESSNCSAPPFC